MGPETLGVLIPITAIIGAFAIAGLKTWSSYQLKMREASRGGDERLAEAVEQLYEELNAVRDEIAELDGRLDFAERLLADPRRKDAIGPGSAG